MSVVYIVLGITDYIHGQKVDAVAVFDDKGAAKKYAINKELKARSRWFKVIKRKVNISL